MLIGVADSYGSEAAQSGGLQAELQAVELQAVSRARGASYSHDTINARFSATQSSSNARQNGDAPVGDELLNQLEMDMTNYVAPPTGQIATTQATPASPILSGVGSHLVK